MRSLALLLILGLASQAAALYCTTYTATGSSGTSTTCSVYIMSGQYISASTCSTRMSGSSASGDTVITVEGPSPSTSQVARNDDNGCSGASYIEPTYVSQSGLYTIRGSCYSTSSCSGTIQYAITSSSASCSGMSCSSCMTTSGCGWCSTGFCASSSSSCYGSFYSYSSGWSSSVCSSSSYYSGGSYYNPYGTSDVSNKGWVAPALLTAVTGVLMITLTSIYGALLCSDCAGCGCAATAADKKLPSVLDSPVGSMHWHSFAVCVLFPLAAILVFVAMCVDAYSQERDDRSVMYGAFTLHQRSTKYTYADLCPAPSGNVITSNNRMCPSLRASGAMTFIGNLLSLGVAAGGLLKFAASAPYEVAGKGATAGGKPVIPLLACRLIVLYMVLNSLSVIMWLVGGHAALSWAAGYNLNDAASIQLGVSWALMFVSMIVMIPTVAIARREALREQPKVANKNVSAVPGQSPQSPMGAQPMAPMQPMGVNMGFAQQPYSGPYGGQPAPVYGQQPMYGAQPMQQQQPMYGQQPMQNMQPGFAPQYGVPQQQQPVVVVSGAPPAYAAPQQQMPVVVAAPAPAAVVRVPVVPPAGLALPPGAILYSNGDVCDASGNVLGVVPGMQQTGTAVVMSGTA